MLISVFTPNYNGARTIERTIRSVLSQQFNGEVEHIIVDDGSTDGSRGIIAQYTDVVALVVKANGGVATAVNAGFEHARGDLVCWLDSDNVALPGAFQAAADAFVARPDASIIYGNYIRMDENDCPVAVCRQITFDYSIALYGYQTVSNAAIYINRRHLQQAGQADPSLRTACDLDLFLRIARHGPVVHVDKYMGGYRVHSNALHVRLRDREIEEVRIIRQRHGKPGLGEADLLRLHRWYKFRALCRMVQEGKIWSRIPPFRSRMVPISMPQGTYAVPARTRTGT